MAFPKQQDLAAFAQERSTDEWRQDALLTVDRELDLIRNVLARGSEGCRFGNATVAAFDMAAKHILEAMHDGIVLFDPERRRRSI